MNFVRRVKDFFLHWWGRLAGKKGGAILEFDAESNASLQNIARTQQRSAEKAKTTDGTWSQNWLTTNTNRWNPYDRGPLDKTAVGRA